MFTRRMLPVSILLTLVLTLMMTASVSAQEAADVEAKFGDWDWEDAVAAGYAPASECVAVPGLGTMGYHFANLDLFGPTFDALDPAVVLVNPAGRVVAVEYIAVDVGQPRPSIFGESFEGPEAHGPGPEFYSLHMWLVPNPDGQFAGFNPSPGVTCPAPAEDALGGDAKVRDANAASDSLVMAFEDVPKLAPWLRYEGWLIAAAGGKVSVGILKRTGTADIEETYVSPSGENLAASYNRFAISLEPVPDPDPETPGPIAYSDAVPLAAFAHIGHLLVAWGPNPDGKGIAVGFVEQMAVAALHADLAKRSSSLEDQQKHSQHVINIIEGSGGANYDASVGDPGDGWGVLNYGADLIKHAGFAKDVAPDDESVGAGADDAIEAAESAVRRAERARENALVVVTPGNSDFLVSTALGNQVSLTSDGMDDAEAAYTASQDIGLFEGLPGEAPPDVGDALVPTVAMAALLVGLLLTAAGGLLVFRRRRTA